MPRGGHAARAGNGQPWHFLGGAGKGASRLHGERQADDAVHQPARPFHLCILPGMRTRGEMRVLRRGDDVSSVRRAHALPLLRAEQGAAHNLPGMRQLVHQVFRRGHAAGGGRGSQAAPRRSRGADGRGHHAGEGRASEASRGLPQGRNPRNGGHADDRQGAGFPERDAGGRGRGGYDAEPAGLSKRRADVSADHAGGGARRARGQSGAGGHSDLHAGSLRHPLRGEAGLSHVLSHRGGLSQARAVSAVHGAGAAAGAVEG